MSILVMTDHVIELLPWYINGRLQTAERNRVSSHLQACTECAAELRMQQQLHAAINASSKVEIAPQPSFNKLWEKIVAEEMVEEKQLLQPRQSSIHSVSAAAKFAIRWLSAHWMPLSLAAQATAIAVLIGVITIQHSAVMAGSNNDAYRTVTSTTPMNGTIIHVVFDDATRVADIKDILLRSSLQVAAGPTAAGVYSLSPANKQTVFNAQEVVHALRDDPRVRFAELSHE